MKLALAFAVLALPAWAEPFRLIVTDLETPLVPNSVMDLALQEGYFARAGVDVELVRVQQTPMALAALQAGEGDMANVGTDAVLSLVARGQADLRAVVSPNKALPFLIAGKPGFKRFGVGRIGSLDHSLSMKVLQSQGIDTAALEIVALGQPAGRAQALLAGEIDATTMSIGIWQSLPDPQGLEVLVDQGAYYAAAPVVSKVNVVPASVLTERRDEVQAVIEALVLASRDFAADREVWVAAMRKARPDVPQDQLDALAAAFVESWSVNGGLQATELAYTAEWMQDGEEFAGLTMPEPAAWIDYGPLDAVLAKLGVAEGMDRLSR